MFKKLTAWESAILLYLGATLISYSILESLGVSNVLPVYGFGLYSLLISVGLFRKKQNYKTYNDKTNVVVGILTCISFLVVVGLYGDFESMLSVAICSQLYMLIPLVHNVFGLNPYSKIKKYLLELSSEDLIRYEFLIEALPFLETVTFEELDTLSRNLENFGLNDYTEDMFYQLIDRGMNTKELNNINSVTTAFDKLK